MRYVSGWVTTSLYQLPLRTLNIVADSVKVDAEKVVVLAVVEVLAAKNVEVVLVGGVGHVTPALRRPCFQIYLQPA